MNILWLVNIIMPEAGEGLNITSSVFGGWLTGALNGVRDILDELTIVTTASEVQEMRTYKVNNVTYIIYPSGNTMEYEKWFKELIKNNNYDIVHVFGTEYSHAEAMYNVVDPKRSVITIQGLIHSCVTHYLDGIPREYIRDTIDRRIMRRIHLAGKSISYQYKEFQKGTNSELRILKNTQNIIGRTKWDYACIMKINSNIRYYKVNETLRNGFYTAKKWSINKCKEHSIFLSQAGYPIKGLHVFLQALPRIREKYPDVKVYIAGSGSNYKHHSKSQRLYDLRYGGYRGYLQSLVDLYQLHDVISYTGKLNEEQMIEQYLKSNVFVLPSSIENSPNSLGEAMLLGVPCVAAFVGGVPDLLNHGREGILYQQSEPHMLAEAVIQIFENPELASEFSQNAIQHAFRLYDGEKNANDLIDVYNEIINCNI